MDRASVRDLVAGIRTVLSSRYVEDRSSPFGPFERCASGVRFEHLPPDDQREVLTDAPFWGWHDDEGLTRTEQLLIIDNVLAGKPQEKWLEGVFDEAALENHKIALFNEMVEEMRSRPRNHLFEEMNGDHLPWAELSADAKLQYIARDAAIGDVPPESFVQVVKDTIDDVGEAALRVVLDGQKELHAIASLLPDDGRLESTPLVERVKDMLEYVSALETQIRERPQNREGLHDEMGELADGKLKASDGKISLRDLRNGSQEQGSREEHQKAKSQDIER
jgi:hypothetical protein